MVESALFDTVPKVTKYQAKEIRDTGVKVFHRAGWKWIGPAAGREFFTDREKMEKYVKHLLEQNLSLYLSRARDCADALAELPVVATNIVPPAQRAEGDKRPDPI